jgi:carbon-monoxide dehydrogenase small subunit
MNVKITLTANGAPRTATVPPMKRLLDVLRDDLGLTGTKEGCGEGECGACSVLLDGEVVNSCLVAACQADGTKVVTVEGLAKGDRLHPVQEAFWEHGGAQCGICTPGMLIASADLLSKNPRPDEATVREALSGNLCRCTGYVKIVESVLAASRAKPAKTRKAAHRATKKPTTKPRSKAKARSRR